jgi:hypothetical protein
MPNIERRLISELIARYALEPTLRDVIVEGDFDRRVVEWFLSEAGHDGVAVYVIDAVQVDDAFVTDLGLFLGSRGRIIALAGKISSALASESCSVTLVADRDLPEDLSPSFPHLLYTDFPSMELYFANIPSLNRFLKLFIGRDLSPVVLEDFRVVLQSTFHLRRAKSALCPQTSWITLSRCCKLVGGRIEFDLHDLVHRLLITNGCIHLEEPMQAQLSKYIAESQSEGLQHVHGHDLIELLSWYVGRIAGEASMRSTKVIERALSLSGDLQAFLTMPLFSTLLARVRS